jgi:ABC-2 type transport system ATP-binding protein
VTTHYVEEAERCQTIAFMHRGRLIGSGSPEQCRAEMGEAVLEVDAVPVMPAAAVVRGIEGVAGVSVYGHTLRVFSPMGGGLDRQIQAALTEAGILVRTVRAVAPTLEDVFLVLTRTAPEGDVGS